MPEAEEDQKSLPSSINFDEYESELQKLKYEEAHKSEKIQRLKDDIARLKELKGEFETR
jgi:predicted  nucleic acid-binding Zn-ribbon protein